jgi:hypothetical protein
VSKLYFGTAELLEDVQRMASLAKGKTVDTAKSHSLKGILKHPEFEQYYPDLADKIKVKFYEGPSYQGGSTENHSDGTYTIRVNKDFREANNWKQVPLTLSHETQHVIQGLERSVKGGRFADVGGTREELLYKLLKRDKLKIYREGSDKKINYRNLPDAKLRKFARKLYESHSDEIESRAAANGNYLRGEIAELKTPFYWVESADRNNIVNLKPTRGAHFMRHKGDEIFGFVDPRNGKVYIHPNKLNANTPIHEFGHLYVSGLKRENKALYDKGIELVKETIYHQRVSNNPNYSNLSEKQKLEEALVTAIGDQGEAFFHETERNAFRRFLERLRRWIVRTFFKNSNKLSKMDLDAFLRGAIRDLMSGRDLGFSFVEDGAVRFQQESSENKESDRRTENASSLRL